MTDAHTKDVESASMRQVIVVPVADVGDEDALNLVDIAAALWCGKWWIFALAVAGAALFGVRAWFTAPVYRAEAIVAVVGDSGPDVTGLLGGQLGSIASLAGVHLSGAQRRGEEYIAMLSSQSVGRELIANYELLPILFASQWDPGTRSWQRTWLSPSVPTIGDGVERMRDRVLRVVKDKDTGLITVRIDLSARELSAKLANRLVELVNTKVRDATISEARRGIEYLNREIARTTEIGVRQAAFRLIESNLQRIMMANVQEQYALKLVDPAVAPDIDRYVRPRHVLETLLGAAGGGMFGVVIALWRRRRVWLPHQRELTRAPDGQEPAAKH